MCDAGALVTARIDVGNFRQARNHLCCDTAACTNGKRQPAGIHNTRTDNASAAHPG